MLESEYIKLSAETVAKFPGGLSMTEGQTDTLHAVLGISTEVPELLYALQGSNAESPEAELGDILFYAAMILRDWATGNNFTMLIKQLEEEEREMPAPAKSLLAANEREMIEKSAMLLDWVKKAVFYGKPISHKQMVFTVIYIVRAALQTVQAREPEVTLESAMAKNYEKLTARFGGRAFDAQRAINKG